MPQTALCNIITWVVAAKSLNVHELYSVGQGLVHNVKVNKYSSLYSNVETKSQLSHLLWHSGEGKRGDEHRLITIISVQLVLANAINLNVPDITKHELCNFPTALFETWDTPRQANKAPARLLKVSHCNCKTGYVSARCNCKRNDWVCSPACGSRQSDGCSNTQLVTDIDNNGSQKMKTNFVNEVMQLVTLSCGWVNVIP